MLSYHHHPHLLLQGRLAACLNSTGLTDQTLPMHYCAEYCQKYTAYIKYYCIGIRKYTAGRFLSSFKLWCNLFGILLTAGGTSGTILTVSSCHILISPPPLPQFYTSGASRICCCDCWELLLAVGYVGLLVCLFVCLVQ